MQHILQRFLLAFMLLAGISSANAQTIWPTPEVEQMYKQAREYHSQGNLRQAVIMYQQAIRIAPNIPLLHRELAHTYYLAKGYNEAITTLEPLIKSGEADAEAYRIMAASLLATNEQKKAKNILKKGITEYPNSGLLYHEMGLMYETDGEIVYALESWLDGIENDPTYHVNYYDAARTYMNTNKTVWAILYAETFINIEQYTPRANDTRKMLLTAYGQLFNSLATGEIPKFGSKSSKNMDFEKAVYDTYIKLSPVISDGITTENLIMLRTRFMMNWVEEYARKYPYTLFSRHDFLIRNGYFDSYNQWLLGKAENPQQYEAWNKFHQEAIPAFQSWLQQNPYHPLKEDFYNEKEVDGIFRKR